MHHPFHPRLWLSCGLFAALQGIAIAAADIEQLQRQFENPPDDSRPMMRWWWYGPAVNKAQLEREMRLMKEGGIGGFEVQPTYPLAVDDAAKGIKNHRLMSPEHLDALTFTAAKAKELGLRFDLTLGSGWPYGGPQFSAAEGATRIETQNLTVPAGQRGVALPQMRDGSSLIAALVRSGEAFKEVKIQASRVELEADATEATQVQLFISRGGIMAVKRPSFGGEGQVIDHYSPTVIEKFIKEMAEPALKACGTNPPYAIFCDSLEVVNENWTPDFLEEFQKRRGYDLKPLLPALFSDAVPKASEIRHDWAQTCTELFNDRFNTRFAKLAKEYGTRFRIQGYGGPPAALHSYAFADLHEAEGYQWRGFDESRWAASASHLLGRPVTSSETWTWLHSPVFMANPLDMKAEANLHFLQGINQLIGHGWPYTAPGIEYPGWRFYAAGVFNEKNPWWIVMPDLTKYLQRCSFMLRQGVPANDVLVYLSNDDAWADFNRQSMLNRFFEGRVSEVTRTILDAGFNLDYCDGELFAMRGKVEGNQLVFGDVKYRAIVLPGVQRIPVATMRRLEEFANNGGIVIATRSVPSIAPGFKATEADHQTVKEIAVRLLGWPTSKGIFATNDALVSDALAKRLSPVLTIEPASSEIGLVHRRIGDGEMQFFFLANTTHARKQFVVSVPMKGFGLNPGAMNLEPNWELWDPMSGRVGSASGSGWSRRASQAESVFSIPVDLEPYGSRFVVFKHGRATQQVAPQLSAGAAGLDVSRGWRVSFKSAAGETNPAPMQMEELRSWAGDEATKYFSGVATYEKAFTPTADLLKPGVAVQLDLGEARSAGSDGGGQGAARGGGNRFRAQIEPPVREAAVVYVNGQRAGSVWCPPYRVEVTKLLKPGENQLRIEVGNLAVNYMAGRPQPDLTELRRVYGNRFDPQDMNLVRPMPSGLLGPVKLVAETAR